MAPNGDATDHTLAAFAAGHYGYFLLQYDVSVFPT